MKESKVIVNVKASINPQKTAKTYVKPEKPTTYLPTKNGPWVFDHPWV